MKMLTWTYLSDTKDSVEVVGGCDDEDELCLELLDFVVAHGVGHGVQIGHKLNEWENLKCQRSQKTWEPEQWFRLI